MSCGSLAAAIQIQNRSVLAYHQTLCIKPCDRLHEPAVSCRQHEGKHIWCLNGPGCCRHNNVLVNAPHPADEVLAEKWDRPYTREQAAFPAAWVQQSKFWPVSSRVDNVHGDRHLIASLPQDEPCQEVEVDAATA